MAQAWYFINPKLTLAELSVQLVVSQSLKHDLKVLFMLGL
jgi:hypothetical protein